MKPGVSDDTFESGDLGREYATTERGESVVAAARILGVPLALFFDDSLIHQALEIVVQGAGAEFVCALRLTRNFLHDAVAMHVVSGEREKDVQGGGG